MIELYAKGTTDFSKNGIRIWPQDSTVTYQENGQWVIDFTVPAGSGYTDFQYGQLIKATVPKQHMEEISLGTVSYYIVSNANGANLYSERPGTQKVSYKNWEDQRSYSQNNYVTYNGENWRCKESHGGISNPPEEGDLWAKASKQINTPGKIAKQMAQGDVIFITSEFNATWYEAAALDGTTGYIRKADVEATGESGERTIPARNITEQIFVITEIDKSREKQEIRIGGEHISYNMKRTTIGGCIVKNVTPATALLFIKGAMREEYGGELYTTLDEPTIDADWSWKNVQSALLDPKNGLVKLTDGQLIRDNMDIFLISGEEQEPKYTVRYGANMKTVNWHGNVTDIVTRVRPLAQTEDGRTLLLPEEYIDTVRNIPFIQPETLNTGLKIGQKEEDSTGAEVELTEAMVIERMRTMANNRFTVDKCDVPEISLDLDWLHMPDTEEYAQYHALENAAPGDWVDVVDGPMGISAVIRMTGYTWDTEKGRYKGAKFGKVNERPTIAGYSIKSGAVGGSAIAHGAVTGAHLMESSITAREIEANSITAQQIASRSIITENLMANCITANEIMAQAITTEKLAALSITTEKLAALAITTEKLASQSVTTEKLAAGSVTADKIAAGEITADKIDVDDLAAAFADINVLNTAIAEIAEAKIGTADIGFAQIKALTTESLIARDAVTDRYFIDKLAVRSAQMVQATVGELIVQATNDHYYRLDINAQGELSPTDVTSSLTNAEKTAGVTSDGHSAIIETDLTVNDLYASNMKAINALIDKLTASRIDVDELFARQATITALNTVDIRGNEYLQLMVAGYGTTYTQWTDPANELGNTVKNGDVWYKGQPMTHAQMANYTHAQLAAFTHKGLEGYQTFLRKNDAWVLTNDPVEVNHTVAMIGMETDRIAIRVNDAWEGIARIDVRASQIEARVANNEGDIAALVLQANQFALGLQNAQGDITTISGDLDALELTVGNKYTVVSGIGITTAGVAVSGNKYINLDVNSGNYVHINQNGIDVKGNKIKVNGRNVFDRDDIIIMRPNDTESWRRTVAGIESHMAGQHDWVMIRPFYDASITYAGVTGQAQQQTPINNKYTESGSYGKAFGGAADWYNYAITLNLQNNASVYRALTVQVFLANKPFEFDNSSADRRVAAAQQANVICPAVTGNIGANNTLTLNISSGHVGYNLCGENNEIYYYINGLNYDGMIVNGNTMNATTDTTNGRVPCTVYYYN